jgi:3-oxoacyl-(acyl-carrier-protein) synthase
LQRFWPYKITGSGILSRAGIGCAETRANLFEGKLKTRPLTPEQPYLNVDLRDEWFERFDGPKRFSSWNLMALVAAQEALDQAGLKSMAGLRVGVSLGSTVGCSNHGVQFSTLVVKVPFKW